MHGYQIKRHLKPAWCVSDFKMSKCSGNHRFILNSILFKTYFSLNKTYCFIMSDLGFCFLISTFIFGNVFNLNCF